MSALAEKLTADELAEAADRLESGDLETLVRRLLALRAQRQTSRLSTGETELLLAINHGLSTEGRARFQTLVAQREAAQLSPEGHAELIRMSDEIERQDGQRMQALIQLAQLRAKPLRLVMDELGIQPPPIRDAA